MNSEKDKKSEIDPESQKLLLKILKIISTLGLKTHEELMVSLIIRIETIVGSDYFIKNEAIEFILNNKPKDLAEVYHFLKCFSCQRFRKLP